MRTLGFHNLREWEAYRRSAQRPRDIPSNPNATYADSGWSGYGDWLGTGNVAPQDKTFRKFEEARAFVRSLALRGQSGWALYSRSGKRPVDIPSDPQRVYREQGWVNFGDWLGTGAIASRDMVYRPFAEAREYARRLGLRNREEWQRHVKSGKKPPDIPANPNQTYRDDGWRGYGDWLGTGLIATHLRVYRSFAEARAFVRDLKLTSANEWRRYAKSGQKPADISATPYITYRDDGWAGWGDWLGTHTVAPILRKYRSFEDARDFVRSLRLRSQVGLDCVQQERRQASGHSGRSRQGLPRPRLDQLWRLAWNRHGRTATQVLPLI